MDENYYREVIDRVRRNDERMWKVSEEPNEGFEDFSKLWGLLFDEEATLSPQTYFEGMYLCFNSFFGTIQSHSYVWSDILRRYEKAVNEDDESFIEEFKKFLRDNLVSFAELPTFYNMIHLAIESGDFEMSCLIFQKTLFDVGCWDDLENLYEKQPEIGAYYEIFTDISFDNLPDNYIFRNTISKLYSKFGQLPEMGKLRDLYSRFTE